MELMLWGWEGRKNEPIKRLWESSPEERQLAGPIPGSPRESGSEVQEHKERRERISNPHQRRRETASLAAKGMGEVWAGHTEFPFTRNGDPAELFPSQRKERENREPVAGDTFNLALAIKAI
ncbi:unnamed protein product [Caretta caretta]